MLRSVALVPKTLQKQLRVETKGVLTPVWKESVAARVTNPLESIVEANTATVSTADSHGLQQVTLQAGQKGKALSGGGKPPQLIAGTEFGSARYKQFGPRRKEGPVYSAAADVIPRIASLWIQTAKKILGDSLDGKAD